MFRLPREKEMTELVLQDFIDKHKQEVTKRFQKLYDAYISEHDIKKMKAKPSYKPDNRIVVNFPKYIVDTTNGFFIGNPVKVTSDDEAVSEFVEYLERYNGQDDNNAELSKMCSIFGKAYEMYFANEDSELCTTYLSPIDAFMIFDDSIIERPLYFVRRYTDNDNVEWGSISDKYGVRHFKISGGVKYTDPDWKPHNFNNDVPATEFIEDDERMGIYEGSVLSMVNAYNKAISEKANDVDYFADSYMKILGTQVDENDISFIRDNRIINLFGEDSQNIVVDFMNKPNNDTVQENLLNRLERLIFQIGQTANAGDENFGTSSGIAMLYKMWSTSNRGKTKARKFESGMDRRYKILFGHPLSKVPADSWVKLRYQFTPNIPRNVLEETQIAAGMEGITSHATQLEVLSVVGNVKEELERIEEEKEKERQAAEEAMFASMAIANAAQNPEAEEPEGTEETEEGMTDEQ